MSKYDKYEDLLAELDSIGSYSSRASSCMNPGGEQGEPEPVGSFLSSYMVVLGSAQTVASGENIVFNVESAKSVGDNIVLMSSGETFTINRRGLYQVEWTINLACSTTSTVVGIVEDGEAAPVAASSTAGSFSSGTLIHVDEVPFTISLHNYGDEITIENPTEWVNSAASIRIIRFADAPSE